MGLDVYLIIEAETPETIAKKFLDIDTLKKQNSDCLDVHEISVWQIEKALAAALAASSEPVQVYWANITHNLGKMASEAEIYEYLWRPEEINIVYAEQLIQPLTKGLFKLKADPDHYKTFEAPNGWGLYENFVPFVERYLEACIDHPSAKVHADR